MKAKRGFTLVELVAVLAIVAILTVFAVPSYMNSMKKSRRADAMSSLLTLQLAQEQWRANDIDYGTLAELGWTGTDSVDGYYTMAVTGITASSFTITATPAAGGPQYRDDCGVFAMNEAGPDYSNKNADSDCWGK